MRNNLFSDDINESKGAIKQKRRIGNAHNRIFGQPGNLLSRKCKEMVDDTNASDEEVVLNA
jgi:hypothetical protein